MLAYLSVSLYQYVSAMLTFFVNSYHKMSPKNNTSRSAFPFSQQVSQVWRRLVVNYVAQQYYRNQSGTEWHGNNQVHLQARLETMA